MPEGFTFFFPWEVMMIKWLQASLGPAGIKVATFFTICGDQVICIAILCFLYYCWDKEFARFVGLNVMTANIASSMIKSVVLRRRPYFDDKSITCHRPPERKGDIYDLAIQGYSFPSGHSSNAVTLFGSIGLYLKKRWLTLIVILLSFLIGLSRICLGVHYPTDVLFGWIIGIIAILLIPWADRKITDKRIFYGLIMLVSSVGWLYIKDTKYYTVYGTLLGFILAIEFEKRFVKFEPTRKPLVCIARIAGGLAVYLVLNTLLKMPFTPEFLESPTIAAYAVRALRYTTTLFATMGVYPMLFNIRLKKKEG